MNRAGGPRTKAHGWRDPLIALGIFATFGMILVLCGTGSMDRTPDEPEPRVSYGSGCEESELDAVVAADDGLVDPVRRHLDDGGSPNVHDSHGNSALACAGPPGHVSVVRALLDAGADPNTAARDGDTVLGDAVLFCQPEVAKVLLAAGADPDESGDSISPLSTAVNTGDAEMLSVLLAGGADPATFDPGATPGPFDEESTSPCSEHEEDEREATVRTLLHRGGDSNAVLSAAVRLESEDIATLALAQGADPDDPAAELALARAISLRDYEMTTLLLQHGANPNHGPVRTRSSDQMAVDVHEQMMRARCTDPANTVACDVATGLFLLSEQARPKSENTTTTTANPLIEALAESYSSSSGENSGETSRATGSPLMVAAWDQDRPVVLELLAAGADVSAIDPNGFTALHAAAATGAWYVIEVLLAADPVLAVNDTPKPSAIADAAGHGEIALLLRGQGY